MSRATPIAALLAAALGMAAGLMLARHLTAAALQTAFGALSLAVAAFLIVQNLFFACAFA